MDKVDLDRFEDALSTRAALSTGIKGGTNYAYMTGYLLSLVRELAYFNPQVADRLKLSIEIMERDIKDSPNLPETGYMAQ